MKSLFLILSFLTASVTWAAVTYTGLSGVSDVTGVSPTFTVYGAYITTATASAASYTCSSTGVCNTCVGDLTFPRAACAEKTVFSATQISLAMNVTALATGASWKVCDGSTEVTAGTTSTSAAKDFSWKITWGALCDALNSTTATGCTTGLSKTLTVGYGTQSCGAFTDKIDFKVYASPFDIAANSDATGAFQEAYSFSLFPGDEKAYLVEELLKIGANYPARTVSGLYWTKLLFYYEAATTLATTNIKNNSANVVSLDVATDGSIEKNYIEGLQNETSYCMRMANKDAAGVIAYFSSTVTDANACVTPSEVVGLLADKKCFIATAAFGSNLDPHVTSFRKFRNEFLLNNNWGKQFVKIYYKYSPALAHIISENKFLKTITRWILWPLLAFVEMSLAWGIWVGFCLLLIAFMLAKIILKKIQWPLFSKKGLR